MNAEQIINRWLNACGQTIRDYNHSGHMNLISKQIKVFGIPGFDVIGYQDWSSQCEHEFQERLVSDTKYHGLKIRHEDDGQIVFITLESISTADGINEQHVIEAILSKETDGEWRLTQERLLDDAEAQHWSNLM